MLLCGYILGRGAGRGVRGGSGASGLLRPLPGHGAYLVLPGRDEGEGLEQQVRACIWLRGLGLLSCPVVIADAGLTPQGWELALRLTARWPGVVLWPASELGDLLHT